MADNDPLEIYVEQVLDGDTVVIRGGDRVRLLGVNAPEMEKESVHAQAYALEATLLVKQLVENNTARLIPGEVKKDKYGRRLGYLETVEGIDVQQTLIERGYGFAVAFPPDIKRLARYQQAEDLARRSAIGVWRSGDWQPQNTDQQAKLNTGFGLFKGHIEEVRMSKKNVLLKVGKTLQLSVRHGAWKEFWDIDPESLLGREVLARGWVSRGKGGFKGQYYLRIRHPFMMQVN